MASSEPNIDLSECFHERMKRVHARLERYLETESESAVHDVRTAIRRLRAAYSAIPSPIKTPLSRRYMKAWQNFFRDTSDLRDGDVIRARLLDLGLPSGDPLLEILASQRQSKLQSLKEQAIKQSGHDRPRLKIADNEVRKAFQRTFEALSEEFLKELSHVLANSSDRDAIHALRKSAKKLFYLLELSSGPVDLERMAQLKRLQRITGEICDCEIVIGFLNEHGKNSRSVIQLRSKHLSLRNRFIKEMLDFLTSVNWNQLLAVAE